ncbi:hypothetical protein RCL1_002381 [Eukaryota sp. TZLM3-RCL]
MSFLSGIFGSKNRHTIQHFDSLCLDLKRECLKPQLNSPRMATILQDITDLVLWSDRNKQPFFNSFLEHGILQKLIELPGICDAEVQIKLLQCLSILLTNLTNTDAIYYLLSNNSINSIINHSAFSYKRLCADDDILPYYIALTKAIALRLDVHTLQFFFDPEVQSCTLYTSSITFFDHKEAHVRLAVRAMTLSLFKLKYQPFLDFVVSQDSSENFGSNIVGLHRPYFKSICELIKSGWMTCFDVINQINELVDVTHFDVDDFNQKTSDLSALLSERFDLLLYLSDVYCLGISDLNHVISDRLSPIVDDLLENLGSSSDFKVHGYILFLTQLLQGVPPKEELFSKILDKLFTFSFSNGSSFFNFLLNDQETNAGKITSSLLFIGLMFKFGDDVATKFLSKILENHSISDLFDFIFLCLNNHDLPPIVVQLGLKILPLITKHLQIADVAVDDVSPRLVPVLDQVKSRVGEIFVQIFQDAKLKPGHFFAQYSLTFNSVNSSPCNLESLLSDFSLFLINEKSNRIASHFRFHSCPNPTEITFYLNHFLFKYFTLINFLELSTPSLLDYCISSQSDFKLGTNLPANLIDEWKFLQCAFHASEDKLPVKAFLVFHPRHSHLAIVCPKNDGNFLVKKLYPVLFVRAAILRSDPSCLNLSAVESLPVKPGPCKLSFANYEDCHVALGHVRSVHTDLLLALKNDVCRLLGVSLPLKSSPLKQRGDT